MSAYLVQDETINKIVSHLFLNVDLEWLSREFSENIAGVTGDFCQDLGAALFALNITAVEERYGKGQAKRFRELNYQFRLETASQLKVYEAITELMYQCAEGVVPSTKLYGLLVTLKAAVADGLVQDINEREREMADELENSLYARCESCCRGLEHDDEHCGAPTARRLLIGIGRVYDKKVRVPVARKTSGRRL
jgi:hypothetical protein